MPVMRYVLRASELRGSGGSSGQEGFELSRRRRKDSRGSGRRKDSAGPRRKWSCSLGRKTQRPWAKNNSCCPRAKNTMRPQAKKITPPFIPVRIYIFACTRSQI
ncbi:hypothetical protein AVEN_260828-1 [Araneus ventricosus]|uniref:Uncharacterized protein n=1 Tax=Araneus ventricosus TaxID=182803 RepID=A0A4Y2WCM6_ARAVE|nr:hypothetical protein AVEN_260828-1 [Araneus ventricosus]